MIQQERSVPFTYCLRPLIQLWQGKARAGLSQTKSDTEKMGGLNLNSLHVVIMSLIQLKIYNNAVCAQRG